MNNIVLSSLEKKFEIAPLERGPVYFAWGTRLLYQIGFVLVWTILIALFVRSFGIVYLPFLFAFEAVIHFLGTFLSSLFLKEMSLRALFRYALSGAIVLVVISFFLDPSTIPFFICLGFAKNLFFSQVNIFLYRQTEELFTTRMAQKFLPFVETAITVGALLGAAMTLILLHFLPLQFVLFGWVCVLLGIFFVRERMPEFIREIPTLKKEHQSTDTTNPLIRGWDTIKKTPFLRFLGWVLFFQMVVFTFIEVEFTTHLQEEILEHSIHESIHESGMHLDQKLLQGNLFSTLHDTAQNVQGVVTKSVQKMSSDLIMHESLAHDLGMFHLFFAGISLIVQLLCTPRFLRFFGIVGTLISYFSVVLLGAVGFVLGYGSINWLRAIQHGTHSLGESSYHIAYYSFLHETREAVRLVFEGVVKPLGILLLLLVLFISHSLALVFLFIGLVAILLLSPDLKKTFTDLSCTNLKTHQALEEKLRSIEVLGQNGHANATKVLLEELADGEHPSVVREALLSQITQKKDPSAVHGYLRILSDGQESQNFKRQVLHAFSLLDVPVSYWNKHAFTQFHVAETLKNIFYSTDDAHIKERVVMCLFRHTPEQHAVPFFLETMDHADEKLKSIYLRSCTHFSDPEIVFYVESYLSHTSDRLRAHAVIALWPFEDHTRLRKVLYDMLRKKEKSAYISALYALGEVGDEESLNIVRKYAYHADDEVQLHALVALAKMSDYESRQELLAFLFHPNTKISKKVFYMLQRAPEEVRLRIQKDIQNQVRQEVAHILSQKTLETLKETERKWLQHLYWLSGRYEDLLVLSKGH